MEQSFIAYIENSIKENWDLDALTDYKGATLQYKDVARKIEKLHIIFEASGIKKGDKIAVCGRNSSHWGVTFLATLTYGAVIVPILHEFKADNVHNIVNHSEAKLLFVGDQVWENLNESAMPLLEGIMMMTDFSILVSRSEKLNYAREHLNEMFGKKYPKNFRKEHIDYHKDQPEELAVINYTSGTTSYSKGVMLPYRSLWSNTAFAFEVLSLKAGDKLVSMLPMAHMYGLAFEFLYEFAAGCHIFFLTRMPSPKIIFQAFAEVKPNLIVAVPLIIEKIIKKNVLPKLETPAMKLLLKVPIINDKIKATVREQMMQAFGGNFVEVIIGGAAFNQEVEHLLRMIDFPYTVGYGMTECAPIICYEDWARFKPGSCGKAAPRMEVKILSPDPENIPGEIVCRGPNVMLGYYKNPEATEEVLDKDDWLHTGDLALMDAMGNVTIKGRSKNMLLGPSGQNIYPEEIEDKLNNLPYVAESIIVQQNEKLVGLVYPDFDDAFAHGLNNDDLERIMEENRTTLNAELPAYSQISKMKIYPEEFEKTPKKSIKRFLYQEAKG
ncbi:long-chain acyl-CoA synthetase [Bacteroides zoogleoformans]|uniref:Long-chain fatty acid--CoA ligase n=1 Tax=Bacteroides zoogleoformans TaxID=28119 RepID=A0ABN5IPG5_9BACE|nr:long-chain fatty acid--CoA ligase [Bacteroides zoogleoformans]AVM53811.1 long-chain fatty acid--CoA ligase [Bacteroides zoogleoformans]TWJ18231.1 long-chain acyl-CoA synthetase [Bacteroides zoogleoformans]